MKTIKQIITVVALAIFMLGSFITNAQVQYKDVGKWHNIVLEEMMKNDEATKRSHLKNPKLAFAQIKSILNNKDPKNFKNNEIDELLPHIENIYSNIKFDNKGLLNLLNKSKKNIGNELFNQIVKFVNNEVGITTLKKLKLTGKDKIIRDMLLDVYNHSKTFWDDYYQNKWSWGGAIWDTLGGVVGGAGGGPIMGIIASNYASYMYDVWVESGYK